MLRARRRRWWFGGGRRAEWLLDTGRGSVYVNDLTPIDAQLCPIFTRFRCSRESSESDARHP